MFSYSLSYCLVQWIMHKRSPIFILPSYRQAAFRDQEKGTARISMREMQRTQTVEEGSFQVHLPSKVWSCRPRGGLSIYNIKVYVIINGPKVHYSRPALQLADSYQLFPPCQMDFEMFWPQRKYWVPFRTLDNEVFSLFKLPIWFGSLIYSLVDTLLNPCTCNSVWKCNCRQAQLPPTDKSDGDLETLAHVSTMKCCNAS